MSGCDGVSLEQISLGWSENLNWPGDHKGGFDNFFPGELAKDYNLNENEPREDYAESMRPCSEGGTFKLGLQDSLRPSRRPGAGSSDSAHDTAINGCLGRSRQGKIVGDGDLELV